MYYTYGEWKIVVVFGLVEGVTQTELKRSFGNYGTIRHVVLMLPMLAGHLRVLSRKIT